MDKPTVLYVDDEEIQRDRFAQYMGRYFRVLTVATGSEGLEILKREPVQVVISDERMSPMRGVDFLKECQRIVPDVPRLMITAYVNEEVLMEAINEGKAQGVIRKPIEGKEWEVINMIQMGLRDYRKGEVIRKQNDELRELVNQIKLSKEKDIAIARLETRHRIVSELGHNLRNPMTSVYGCYQILGEMGERCEKEKLSDAEKMQMLDQAVRMIGIAVPDMKRLYQLQKELDQFIRDEKDPAGDAMGLRK